MKRLLAKTLAMLSISAEGLRSTLTESCAFRFELRKLSIRILGRVEEDFSKTTPLASSRYLSWETLERNAAKSPFFVFLKYFFSLLLLGHLGAPCREALWLRLGLLEDFEDRRHERKDVVAETLANGTKVLVMVHLVVHYGAKWAEIQISELIV